MVRSWISGSSIPADEEWDFLLCVSREFVALAGMWREARLTHPPESRPTQPVDLVESTQAQTTERTPPDTTRPMGPPGDAVSTDRGGRDDHASAVRPPRTTPASRFDDYACKITGGRIVRISLPSEFSRADASRVYAFLLTQVDDGLPGPEGST